MIRSFGRNSVYPSAVFLFEFSRQLLLKQLRPKTMATYHLETERSILGNTASMKTGPENSCRRPKTMATYHLEAKKPMLENAVSTKSGPENSCSSKDQPCGLQFLQCNVKKDYLTQVSDYVSKHRHQTFALKSPTGATLKVGHLEDTIYSGEDDEVNGWGELYLPKAVSMVVMGVVEGISCPCDQLILMTCEDGQLYVFDGEEVQLHLVASSTEQLNEEGMEYPSSKIYNRGDALKYMTDEAWAEMKRRLHQEHYKVVMSIKSRFPGTSDPPDTA